MDFKHAKGYSLVTIILPSRTGADVVEAIGKAGGRNIISLGARGTVLTDDTSWLARKFPPPAPQQDVLQVLVPDSKLDTFATEVIKVGGLHVSGAGAIFSTPCDDAHYSEKFHFWESSGDSDPVVEPKKKMIGINCIVERAYAEPITQAAVLAGSPGPTVTFAEGRGLRDKIRLLRIAKTPEKEIVQVVVEDVDADLVFSEMSRAGKITEPGRGFIYTFPVTTALINSTSTEGDRKHSASMQEIITAIDELKGGNKSWRGYDPLARAATKDKQFANEKFLNDLVNMTCIANRDNADIVMDAIFKAGAPAASVAYGKVLDPVSEADGEKGMNVEWGVIQAILSPALVDKVRDTVIEACDSNKIEEACIYTFPVPKAQTFLG